MDRILAINPGSTSTKLSVFEDAKELFGISLSHDQESLAPFSRVADQADFRMEIILNALKEHNFDISTLTAVVGRGGIIRPIPSGTYAVNEQMLADLQSAERGEHASNLGAILAKRIAEPLGIPSFIVDPVVVDELADVARLSGHPLLPRVSLLHALNQKAMARRYAKEHGRKYEDLNLIVAHMGGGISVAAHEKGRIVDVNNALSGEGPFSPERSGGVPCLALAKLCFSGEYTFEEVQKMLVGRGGYVSYLRTNDGRTVQKCIDEGDKDAELVQNALAYQVSKEIAANAAVLQGKVDALILTGGLAYNKSITSYIDEHVSFIAPLTVYPGEDEMEALCQGALRVLQGEEDAREYTAH